MKIIGKILKPVFGSLAHHSGTLGVKNYLQHNSKLSFSKSYRETEYREKESYRDREGGYRADERLDIPKVPYDYGQPLTLSSAEQSSVKIPLFLAGAQEFPFLRIVHIDVPIVVTGNNPEEFQDS